MAGKILVDEFCSTTSKSTDSSAATGRAKKFKGPFLVSLFARAEFSGGPPAPAGREATGEEEHLNLRFGHNSLPPAERVSPHLRASGSFCTGRTSEGQSSLTKWKIQLVTTILAMGLEAGIVCGQTDPRTFLKERIKLTDSEIQTMEIGQVAIEVLASGDTTYGTLILGGVYVNAPISKFAEVCRDISKLEGEKGYIAVQEFSHAGTPPNLSDFDRLDLERRDIDQLEHCKPGDCDFQVFDIVGFKKRVNWKAKDKYAQANQLVRQRIYEGMTRYQAGGLKSLGSYTDRSKPLNLYHATKDMVDRSFYLPPDKAGEIYRHVLEYPQGKLEGAEDVFYWEKTDFGLGATVRVNHLTLFPKGEGPIKLVVANKQLYSSQYIRAGLQMFYCIPDTQNPSKSGFFLIEINDSRLPDFESSKLAMFRKAATAKAVERTRDTLEIYQRRTTAK